ncbi:MAG: hypothetical protein ACOH5I_05010 [Oligoflexus sp.]
MSIVELVHPADYFRSKVNSAASALNLQLKDEVEFYLVNLLCEFIQPQQLAVDEIDLLDTPLALIYKKAIESSPDMQIKIYKRLGDTSLYIAGYFQDSLNRKTVGAGYYISMGATAYDKISNIMRDRHGETNFTRVYAELAKEFKNLVNLVTEVSEDVPGDAHRNLLAIYERWHRTGSEKLRKILEDQGISPVPLSNKFSPQ